MDRRVKERLIGATLLVIVIVLVVPELLSGPKPAHAPPPANAVEAVRTYTVDLAQNTATPQPAPAATPQPAPAATPQPAPPAPSKGAPANLPAPTPGTPVVAATTTLTAGTAAPPTTPGAGKQPPTVAGVKAAAAAVMRSSGAAPVPLESAASSPISVQHVPAAAPATAPVVPSQAVAVKARSDQRDATAPGAWTVQLGSFANRAHAQTLASAVKAKGFNVYISSTGAGAALRYRVRTGPWADRDAALQTVLKLQAQGQAASLVPPAP
jgi:DedD protein